MRSGMPAAATMALSPASNPMLLGDSLFIGSCAFLETERSGHPSADVAVVACEALPLRSPPCTASHARDGRDAAHCSPSVFLLTTETSGWSCGEGDRASRTLG